ncbi:hypothetical protein MANY_32810 [Mycolicibacterium anyangense]|uniref:Nitroreductase n=1 Tax=Mycolicibacterium anyangense TaxID=1431246 RepID=A0A6N4WCX7_9MYCO|nr:nitroreductase family deazaflavin-dependent oxidoreductase [Mycolicibacterium anyangense]BBZ77944.1 hypothetical protein MANY_32810 [Mycolicibacterium anyangense]
MARKVQLAPDSWPRQVRDLIRLSNKYLLNPVMLRLAGTKYWYAAVIRHTGRKSGKHYATPVVADRVGDRFIVPLPYGTQVDWLRNVLTAGRARISNRGETYEVVAPEIIDATEALPLLRRDRRRTFERTGIEHFLRVRIS